MAIDVDAVLVKAMTEDQRFNELSGALQIQQHALDVDVAKHAEFVFHVGAIAATLQSELDQAKSALKKVDAGLSLAYRANPEGKVTEGIIEARIASDANHIAAEQTFLVLLGAVNRWNALKEAFTARGYMLREMCQLTISRSRDMFNSSGPHASNVEAMGARIICGQVNAAAVAGRVGGSATG